MANIRPISKGIGYEDTRSKGNLGEEIACRYLVNKGFRVITRNFLRKWGELDIIAEKDNITHFFEVKSVTNESFGHRPEDNVHAFKARHIRRMIETYLGYIGQGLDAEFGFHVICVFMDMKTRRARVKWIENVIL